MLNNHPSVRPLVRERVQQVIQEHRYTPRAAARSLASRRTNVVGLLIPRSAATIFSDPFFPHVIQGITEACSNRGYFLMLSMVTVEREQDFYERVLRGRHVDGLLLMSSDIDDPILPLLIRDETPLVLVGRHPYLPDVSSADVDNRRWRGPGGAPSDRARASTHRHHHRSAVYGRRHGSARWLQAGVGRGGHPDSTRVDRRRRLLPGRAAFRACARCWRWTSARSAVFVASDSMAAGALRALHEAGIDVPGDVGLVSFDDLPLASILTPPLTTVHQPLYELGATAAEC